MQKIVVNEKNGDKSILIYIPNFYSESKCNEIKKYLDNINDWKVAKKKNKNTGRKQKWFHLSNKSFCNKWTQNYDRWNSNTYSDFLLKLQFEVNKKVNKLYLPDINKSFFNSLLINYYPDGNYNITPHQDTHKAFGKYPTIALLSFGVSREFYLERTLFDKLKRDKNKKYMNKSFLLEEGSLFIMAGSVQRYFCHSIKKNSNIKKKRYSLTFREHLC